MPQLSEDDIYRASSQFRLWSFTRGSLASLRATTNELAADGVRAAVASLKVGKGDDGASTEVDCLTVEEEQKLVGFYCVKALEFADFCGFPTNVKATAVQYMRRFYLSNSPMTYHPKEIMPSAVFLSTKTENHYISLKNFAAKYPKATEEKVVAPEFLLTQGLRFTFDVRHPQRALEGGYMELVALAKGNAMLGPDPIASAKKIQSNMLNLKPAGTGGSTTKSTTDLVHRIQAAYNKVKDILKTSALLTDAYFLFTPSQIWLSALLVADQPLGKFYVDLKISPSSGIKPRFINTLKSCCEVLEASPSAVPVKAEVEVLTKIDKKLYKCRNPEKIDLVSINKAQKIDGEGGEDGQLDEKVIKKRKLEREKSEREGADLFGPSIPTRNGSMQ